MTQATDWLERWRELVNEREAQRQRWSGGNPAEQWGERSANLFSQMARDLSPDDPSFAFLRDSVQPGDTVLDVGSGAGRYALAIAPYVKEVVAFDPSKPMLDALAKLAQERDISNIRIVQGTWPDASSQVDPANVVFCAHSFYWSPEIEPFLKEVARKAKRKAILVIRVEQQDLYLYGLVEELRNNKRSPEPNAIELLGALKQVGIYADLTTVSGYGRTYGSLDEVAQNAAMMLGYEPLNAPMDVIREQLKPSVVELQGRFSIGQAVPLVGLVHWETDRAGASR